MLVTMTESVDPQPGDELELDIDGVAHGGVFVARHEGRVVFVADAIPGERVRARLSDTSHARFWRAETTEVDVPSPDRREHIWAEAALSRDPADRAGGAEFGHISLDRQRELKTEVLTDSLRRFGHVEADGLGFEGVEMLPGASDGTGWRTRVRLHVGPDGTVGPFAARSHRVIPVETLPLATADVARAAPREIIGSGVEAVDVLATSTGDVRVWSTPVTDTRTPEAAIVERVRDREFRLAAGGFWQVHTHAAATLTEAVQEAVDADLFDPSADNLDLYGGVGLLAAAVGDRFGARTRITSVESDPVATGYAGENLADWVGARAVTARVDRFLAELRRQATRAARERLERSTVVLDPPRSGAGKAVVRTLADLRPAQLVYVACDPVALARDVGLAAESGYRLTRLRAFDLFPNTHHIEAVATFLRE